MVQEIKAVRIRLRHLLFEFQKYKHSQTMETYKENLFGTIKGLEFRLNELSGKKVQW